MYIKLIFKKTINNKQVYFPRLYKYRDSYVLYIPLVNAFGSLFLTHTLLVQTHTDDVSAPCTEVVIFRPLILFIFINSPFNKKVFRVRRKKNKAKKLHIVNGNALNLLFKENLMVSAILNDSLQKKIHLERLPLRCIHWLEEDLL